MTWRSLAVKIISVRSFGILVYKRMPILSIIFRPE